jgi:hypothetical protein
MSEEEKNRSRDSSVLLMLASGALSFVLLGVVVVSLLRGQAEKIWGVLVFGIINGLICCYSWLRVYRPKPQEPIQSAETTRGK